MESNKENLPVPFSKMTMTQTPADLPPTRVSRYYSFPNHSSMTNNSQADPNCRPVGLENLGSTCWFNVAVQVLYHIPIFRQTILEFKVPSHLVGPGQPFETVAGLQELFICIMYSERKLIDPTRAVQSIGKLLGHGQGQQDASEFLGLLLSRVREVVAPGNVLERLFVGSTASSSACDDQSRLSTPSPPASIMPLGDHEEFMQYPLQLTQDTSLLSLLDSSLSSKLLENGPESDQLENDRAQQHHEKKLFAKLPPVFLVDLCRVVKASDCNVGHTGGQLFVKVNCALSFPSVIFMDRFLLENTERVVEVHKTLVSLQAAKEKANAQLQSLNPLLQNVPQLKAVYANYQRAVDQQSTVDFDLLCALNRQWEAEIQVKMDTLLAQSAELERAIEETQSRQFSTCRPYQLHSVIVHRGELDGGHYWTYVWDSQHQLWFHIDDNYTQQVTWDVVVQAAFGGTERESNARCLIYTDTLQSELLLEVKGDYVIGPTDVLRYLKDNTDVRTRHAAYGKGQTQRAILGLTTAGHPSTDASKLLYQALDSERHRLYGLCRGWMSHSGQLVDEESRLLHFGVYLLANKVGFEPYVYWTLLQHFSGYGQLVDPQTSPVCHAARHALAFLEHSTTQEEKKRFIQWNTAYYQFRLIVRHVMNGITHVFSGNFSAALPLAVKALYLHHGLTNNSLKGPAMSIRPGVIHALIDKSVTSLSEELLDSELESVSDVACTVLFNSIINWCEYSDKDNLEAARSSSRLIADRWSRRIGQQLALGAAAAECVSGFRTLAEVQRKLAKVESVLTQQNESGNPTPFDFKGHIPENPDDGEKLAAKWKQMWLICVDQRILNL